MRGKALYLVAASALLCIVLSSCASTAGSTSSDDTSGTTASSTVPTKTEVEVENAVPSIGPYSQMLKAGGFIYCSGQVGFVPETGKLVEGGITEQTRQALDNIEAELEGTGASIDDVVKVTVYLTDMDDFSAMNEEYAKHFSKPYPVRTCVQIVTNPVEGSLVLIDVTAVDPNTGQE